MKIITGIEFYNLLHESEKFTSELGKVTLSSGKLETEIKFLLKRNGINSDLSRATLGQLIGIVNDNNIFDENLILALKQISKKRNYITHNLYALFSDLIEETILKKNDLMEYDVTLYIHRVWHLNQDLNGLADLIKEKK
jgi:hypothetical protein